MRKAKAQNAWQHIEKGNFSYHLKSIDLRGHCGFSDIEISKGIFAVCGLNGAGKTTVLAAIKTLFGSKRNEMESVKCEGLNARAVFRAKDKEYILESGVLCPDLDDANGRITSVDANRIYEILKILSQENVGELLESLEFLKYDEDAVRRVSQLVGKSYNSVQCCEIEEFEEFEAFPYFRVVSGGVEYASERMGLGEHFLLCIDWFLHSQRLGRVLLVEEPETSISIMSQRNLVNLIAHCVSEAGISCVLTTHSPFILDQIPPSHISLISRDKNGSISILRGSKGIEPIHKILDMPQNRLRPMMLLLVEDLVAAIFLQTILDKRGVSKSRDIYIEMLSGEDLIRKVLSTEPARILPKVMIGVFDSDLREAYLEPFARPHVFLPGDGSAAETSLRQMLNDDRDNCVQFVASHFKLEENVLRGYLAKLAGEDYHDWPDELSKMLDIKKVDLVKVLSERWIDQNSDLVDGFIDELEVAMGKNDY